MNREEQDQIRLMIKQEVNEILIANELIKEEAVDEPEEPVEEEPVEEPEEETTDSDNE